MKTTDLTKPTKSRLSKLADFYSTKAYLISGIVFFITLLLFLFGFILPIPTSVYLVAVIFLLQLVMEHVTRLEKTETSPRVFADEVENLTGISDYIKSHRPKMVDMLEYSGSTITNIFREFAKGDTRIRLLLFDPRKTDDAVQRSRIKDSYLLKKIEIARSARPENIEISFYDTPSTLSGLNLDDQLVTIGWYTVTRSQSGETVLFGHSNPFLLSYATTPEGAILWRFFKRHFEILWNQRIPASEIEKWWDLSVPQGGGP